MRYSRILIGLIGMVPLAVAAPAAANDAVIAHPKLRFERSVVTSPGSTPSATAGFAYVVSEGLLLAGAAYDSVGGTVTASHLGTGQYEVVFGHLGFPAGDAQVTSLQGIPCVVGSWTQIEADVDVFVDCYNSFGDPVDAGFEVLVTQPKTRPTGTLDYDWVYKGSGRLTGVYQYNSSHKVNSVRHPATGEYVVTMPGPGRTGAGRGTVMVSAYGAEAGSCQVARWLTTTTGEQITVRCYDAGGAPQNRKFEIIYARGTNLMGQNGKTTANAFANGGGVMYQPKVQFDSRRGARVTIVHLDKGFYEAIFIGSPTNNNPNGGRGNILVTPVSSAPRTCEIQPTFAHVTITFISCSDARQNPADTAFTVQFVVNG
jgi:hypothetical protein